MNPLIIMIIFIIVFFALINFTITPGKRKDGTRPKKQGPIIGIALFALVFVAFYFANKPLFDHLLKSTQQSEKPAINEITPTYEFSYNPEVETGCEENIANLMLNTQVGNAVILATDTLGEANSKLCDCGIKWEVDMPYKTEDGKTAYTKKGKGPYSLGGYLEPGYILNLSYIAVDRVYKEDLYVYITAMNKTDKIIPSSEATITSISVGTYNQDVYSSYFFAIPYVSKETTYQDMKLFMNQHFYLTGNNEIEKLLQLEKLSYQYENVKISAAQRTGRFIQAERSYNDNMPVEKNTESTESLYDGGYGIEDYLQSGDPNATHYGGDYSK